MKDWAIADRLHAGRAGCEGRASRCGRPRPVCEIYRRNDCDVRNAAMDLVASPAKLRMQRPSCVTIA
jgi:hypothetical protein